MRVCIKKPRACSHFWFWLLCFSQVALLTIVYKKKAGQPSCYYRHLKKRRVEKEKANRGANKQVNRRSTSVTLATLVFARLVALLLLKNIIIYIKKIKKKEVRKSQKYIPRSIVKEKQVNRSAQNLLYQILPWLLCYCL